MESTFKEYQHIERWGTDEVDGIEFGECLVFSKIDGTNGSVWLKDTGEIGAASRKRELTCEKDNAGFCKYVLENESIRKYLTLHPRHRLFGEFLVPHSFKDYREDAWRKFYIFDIYSDETREYISYFAYQPLVEECGLDYIPPIAKINNPTYEGLIRTLEQNDFLVKDGKGCGEGIVIKNYAFYNKYGRQTWAKIVTSEFKEKHRKAMGPLELQMAKMIEQTIVEDFCTEAFIQKEFDKIVETKEGWKSQYIPELLGRVFSELIKEETWNFVKKLKYPKVDFKTLNALVIQKIKAVKADRFG